MCVCFFFGGGWSALNVFVAVRQESELEGPRCQDAWGTRDVADGQERNRSLRQALSFTLPFACGGHAVVGLHGSSWFRFALLRAPLVARSEERGGGGGETVQCLRGGSRGWGGERQSALNRNFMFFFLFTVRMKTMT